ncbi:Uncharacterized protein GBIM_07292 [Gryllus bimaculatus]|nr:Uncharacterized protein GBIM_07292 [Gryllus bimaculatus]
MESGRGRRKREVDEESGKGGYKQRRENRQRSTDREGERTNRRKKGGGEYLGLKVCGERGGGKGEGAVEETNWKRDGCTEREGGRERRTDREGEGVDSEADGSTMRPLLLQLLGLLCVAGAVSALAESNLSCYQCVRHANEECGEEDLQLCPSNKDRCVTHISKDVQWLQ